MTGVRYDLAVSAGAVKYYIYVQLTYMYIRYYFPLYVYIHINVHNRCSESDTYILIS